jgi:low affinity Fe/Cu permease
VNILNTSDEERDTTLIQYPDTHGKDAPMNGKIFADFATATARASGSPLVMALSAISVAVWLLTGPIFHYSDTWQLVMNTWTNVITFLMVFLIQNSQNRDSSAIQLKLDELIHTGDARNLLVGVENLTENEIEALKQSLEARAHKEAYTNREND